MQFYQMSNLSKIQNRLKALLQTVKVEMVKVYLVRAAVSLLSIWASLDLRREDVLL